LYIIIQQTTTFIFAADGVSTRLEYLVSV